MLSQILRGTQTSGPYRLLKLPWIRRGSGPLNRNSAWRAGRSPEQSVQNPAKLCLDGFCIGESINDPHFSEVNWIVPKKE